MNSNFKEDGKMSKVVESSLELIGGTPLLKADRYAAKANATEASILVKLEYLNPAGSVKDRVALSMIEDAEKKGILKPGSTIIEPTSGNTGIGLAAVAAAGKPVVVLIESEHFYMHMVQSLSLQKEQRV